MMDAFWLQKSYPFDNTACIAREKLHEDFFRAYEHDSDPAPFAMCGRWRYYEFERVTPYDASGECSMCGIDIVYDRKITGDSLPKVCLPCALRLYKSGCKELSALGSYQPTDADVSDADMMARLHANVFENKRGATDPKHVLPTLGKMPEHGLAAQRKILKPR